jgi:hypothetical protein
MGDAYVRAELRRAWFESLPHAPAVPKGHSGSQKREQGGFIYWASEAKRLRIERLPPGSRDELPGVPLAAQAGLLLVASFHTHPNTVAEGYAPDPSPADRYYAKHISKVPELIETHDGRKVIDPEREG